MPHINFSQLIYYSCVFDYSHHIYRYQPEEEPTKANLFMKGTLESKDILPNVKIFLNDSASS